MELLNFVSHFKSYAPFNGMLLHIQRPGITFVANTRDWMEKFGRQPKLDARPLIILRNFGPVNFVYDVQDTEGEAMPEGALRFETSGTLPNWWLGQVSHALAEEGLTFELIDNGDANAGHLQLVEKRYGKGARHLFKVVANRRHSKTTQFATIIHELAHLYLGHLTEDTGRKIKGRTLVGHDLAEVEAESVAYVVCRRVGVEPQSQKYLKTYEHSFVQLERHLIMKTVQRIETLLKLPFKSA